MRTLKTSEAAALLNVSPNTLRTWERRFGYPKPRRSPGRHRLYAYAEIAALREVLEDGLSISTAISVASEAFGNDGHAVTAALSSFRADEADLAMEGSLALRSVERSVEEVLLPALQEILRRKGHDSATWAFSCRWAADWLRRAHRLASPGTRHPGVLVGDATAGLLDPASAYLYALELDCALAGARVLCIPVCALARIAEPVEAIRPAVVVIAGDQACDDEVARWAYGVHRAAGDVPFVVYHRCVGINEAQELRTLPDSPLEARATILRAA